MIPSRDNWNNIERYNQTFGPQRNREFLGAEMDRQGLLRGPRYFKGDKEKRGRGIKHGKVKFLVSIVISTVLITFFFGSYQFSHYELLFAIASLIFAIFMGSLICLLGIELLEYLIK